MSWLLLLSLTAITFFNRYIFLEPKMAIVLPSFLIKMLKYAAPCLMISIAMPIVFFEHYEWKGVWHNYYFYGACFTILVAVMTEKLLSSIVLSLLFFYLLIYLF